MPPVQHYIQEISKLLSLLTEDLEAGTTLEDQLTVIKRVFRSQLDNDSDLKQQDRQELYKILDYQTNNTFQPASPIHLHHLPTGTIIFAKKDQIIWTKRNTQQKIGIWESEGRTLNVQDNDVRESPYFEILYVPH